MTVSGSLCWLRGVEGGLCWLFGVSAWPPIFKLGAPKQAQAASHTWIWWASKHCDTSSYLHVLRGCSIYNNITQLDIPTRRRQVATESPSSSEDEQQPQPQPDNGVPVYVMLPLDTVWLLERDGRKFSVSRRLDPLGVRAAAIGCRTSTVDGLPFC